MFIATLIFACADSLAKHLTSELPLVQLAWLRTLIGLVLLLLFAKGTNRLHQLKTQKPAAHFLRSILGTIMLLGVFYGLKHIPLAEVTAIVFSTPITVALFSPILLKEKVSRKSWIAIGIGFLGVLIVARPTPDHFHLAHLVTFCYSTGIAFLIISARRLAKTETALALNIYLYPLMLVISFYWVLTDWVTPTTGQWLLIFFLGLTATAALGFVMQAMRYAKPAVVAPIDYFRMVWSLSLGYIFWSEVPASITWVGIAIIVLSGIYIASHGRIVPEVGVNKTPID